MLVFAGTRTQDLMGIAIRLAGFDCRDEIRVDGVLAWEFGCLSEDTEILVDGEWVQYQDATAGHLTLCYDSDGDTLSWQPIQNRVVYEVNDTLYHIYGSRTDQFVTGDHRCPVERGGTTVFLQAYNLTSERNIRVPILENLRHLFDSLPLPHFRTSATKKELLQDMCGEKDWDVPASSESHTQTSSVSECSLRGYVQTQVGAEEKTHQILLCSLCSETQLDKKSRERYQGVENGVSRAQGVDGSGVCTPKREDDGATQSRMEGRSNDLQEARELQGCEICSVPARVPSDGSEGRLCDEASSDCSKGDWSLSPSKGDGASRGPKSDEQHSVEPVTVQVESGPQTVRASRFTTSDLVRVELIPYTGKVWCVKVPTGAFVARRNGKVFITGNSGFPKSKNVSLSIDKGEGLPNRGRSIPTASSHRPGTGEHLTSHLVPPYEAQTEQAKAWDGWGTGLKPSHEPILMFRKPLAGTVAETVLKHGTGAINIDGCRVDSGNEYLGRNNKEGDNGWKNSSGGKSNQAIRQDLGLPPQGRWPSNLVFCHTPDCVQTGTRTVDAPVINRFDDGMKPFGEGAGHPYTTTGGGTEDIAVWECVPGCPVRALDEQSGILTSGEVRPGYMRNSSTQPSRGGFEGGFGDAPLTGYGDSGGASRFFPQFQYTAEDAPFKYVSKTNRSERNEGLEGLPRRQEGRQDENHHPCLHPEALVLTDCGYRPINTVQVGDKVYAADGTFRSVTHTSRHPYTSPYLIEISVRGTNETTLASDNHPFLIWRPVRKFNYVTGGSVMWLWADQIQRGDYTMTPVLKPGIDNPDLPKDPDFWFLFGLYLAEGVLQKAGHGNNIYPSYSLHQNETHLVERIQNFFGVDKVSVYPCVGSKGIQVLVFRPDVGPLFLTLGGKGAANKRVSPLIWNLPRSLQNEILAGWIAGDGGAVRQHIQCKTVSNDLAAQMYLLAEGAGYRTRIYKAPASINKGIGNRKFKTTRPCYQLDLSSKGSKAGPVRVEHDGTTFSVRIVSKIKQIPYVGDVVNLSVEGVPTFQTAVGMSHNTLKPIELMQWLVRLVTPPDGIVLDPFTGSGSTGCAAVMEEMRFVGIEREAEYVEIARARITHHELKLRGGVRNPWTAPVPTPKKTESEPMSMADLFGFDE
jgi:hypothetical protein